LVRLPLWALREPPVVEYLPVDEHAAAFGAGHAGRVLAAVPEHIEPVVREVGDRFPRSLDPACLARMVDT
jgi:hypothetical protein